MNKQRTRLARNEIKKTRKRKKRVRFLSILLLLLVSTIAYSVYEYKAGVSEASNKSSNDPTNVNELEEFSGEKSKLGKINVLLLGTDSGKVENSRTDTIMIAQYDPKAGTAKVASIMRDTYVSIPGYKNNKINSAYFYGGPELLRQTIKENFGIDVEYYALVNFDGFTEVVDVIAPKGIEIDVEKRMRYSDPTQDLYIKLDEGLQKLDGENLLNYARFRNDAEGDFGRVRRQQQVMNAVKEELFSIKAIVKAPRLLGTINPYINTNIDRSDFLSFGKSFLLNSVDEIETLRIPVEGSYQFARYSHAGSVIDLDKDENKEALNNFFNPSKEQTVLKEETEEEKS